MWAGSLSRYNNWIRAGRSMDRIPDCPMYTLWPSQRHLSVTWILAQYVYYRMQVQSGQSLQDCKFYIRKEKWEVYRCPRRQRVFGRYLDVLWNTLKRPLDRLARNGCLCNPLMYFVFYDLCNTAHWDLIKSINTKKIPVGERFFAHVQTDPGAHHPASCTMATGSFPGVNRPGHGADHPPPSSAEVENE
jgi:hypothetical protein